MDNMIKHLEALMNDGTGLKLKGDNAQINGKDSVELFDLITNQSLSETFNGMVQKRYQIEDLKQKVVNATNVDIMVIGPERIYENYVTSILKEDVDTFMHDDNVTQAFGLSVKNAPAYKPKVKELCVVEIKEPEGKIWYRCQYQQELVDDHAQVYCFDYGKIERVRANNIRVSIFWLFDFLCEAITSRALIIVKSFFLNSNEKNMFDFVRHRRSRRIWPLASYRSSVGWRMVTK